MRKITLPKESKTKLSEDLEICRVLNGMWQVSGAHGRINKEQAIKSMVSHVKHGFITFDLADHYGPAEDFVKIFRNKLKENKLTKLLNETRFFTKWVPHPQKITRKIVSKAIDVSRKRMGMSTLDMLQFHWWDYQDDNYIKALEYLDDLREEHVISHLALTNFDSEHLEKIISMGIPIVSNQVQYSIIDRRPERKMAEVCKKHNVKLLAYGTLGGGLFTERYYQKSEPKRFELNTASLQKYKYMLDRWGDWRLFQNLLNTLKEIADKYGVSIANVAVRYVLEQDFVGGAIIGIRLGASEHIQENSQIFSFSLNEADIKMIDTASKDSNNLFEIIGDCGDEYR